ncbi:MAG: AI-2E family transporter [Acidobacteria bacterium]|nr:AI-2E family transporter [Acidobacteriota bacterium]MXZ72050.1 AI-2E family transporter [Acidobacteriota bacterium]MYD70983.1 AI-2E family transporter [Acidobacteriota bacterium]MYJ02939.1 AI-2E family transporter [Acidobacteriota bacterium]
MTDPAADHRAMGGMSVRYLVAAACLVIIIAGLRAAAELILPFLVAVFLAIVNVPVMNWLVRMKVPKPLAVLGTILMAVTVIGALVAVLAGSINQLTAAVPAYQARLGELAESLMGVGARFGLPVEQWTSLDLAPSGVFDLLGGVIGDTVRAVGAFLSNTFLVLLTVIFILFEAAGFSRKITAAFGAPRESFSQFTRMAQQVQTYLVVKTAMSAATGLTVGIWVALMGLDFPLLWGVLAFLFNFIPTLGSIVAAVPAVMLAIVQFGPGRAAVIAAGYLAINVIFGNGIEPTLMGRRLGLSTLVVFGSLVFWGWVWGPVGMLFSVPLTMAVKIVLENSREFRWVAILLDANPAPQPAAKE